MTEPEKNTGLKNRFEVKKPVKNRFGFLNRFTALSSTVSYRFFFTNTFVSEPPSKGMVPSMSAWCFLPVCANSC